MRNVFLFCVFGVLTYSPFIYAADEEKAYYFHMHPEGVGEKRMLVYACGDDRKLLRL